MYALFSSATCYDLRVLMMRSASMMDTRLLVYAKYQCYVTWQMWKFQLNVCCCNVGLSRVHCHDARGWWHCGVVSFTSMELRMAILKKQKNGNRMCIWNTSLKYHITDSRGKLYTMHVIRLMPRYKMRYCKYANVNG